MRGAHSAHVTGVAEEMRVQREALRAGLIGELLTTLLRKEGGGGTTDKQTEEVRSLANTTHLQLKSQSTSLWSNGRLCSVCRR